MISSTAGCCCFGCFSVEMGHQNHQNSSEGHRVFQLSLCYTLSMQTHRTLASVKLLHRCFRCTATRTVCPPCASVTPISARYIRQFSRPFPGSPLRRGGITHGASTRLRCGTLCETSHTSCMYSFPLHCNRSRLPTPGPIVNSNLGALCPLIPLLPLLLPHHPEEAYPLAILVLLACYQHLPHRPPHR